MGCFQGGCRLGGWGGVGIWFGAVEMRNGESWCAELGLLRERVGRGGRCLSRGGRLVGMAGGKGLRWLELCTAGARQGWTMNWVNSGAVNSGIFGNNSLLRVWLQLTRQLGWPCPPPSLVCGCGIMQVPSLVYWSLPVLMQYLRTKTSSFPYRHRRWAALYTMTSPIRVLPTSTNASFLQETSCRLRL